MKTIRIKADPASAAKAINSNRPFKVGDQFSANDTVAAQILHSYGDLFEEVVPIEQQQKDAPAGHQENKLQAPGKNKKLAKSSKFKTKAE